MVKQFIDLIIEHCTDLTINLMLKELPAFSEHESVEGKAQKITTMYNRLKHLDNRAIKDLNKAVKNNNSHFTHEYGFKQIITCLIFRRK